MKKNGHEAISFIILSENSKLNYIRVSDNIRRSKAKKKKGLAK